MNNLSWLLPPFIGAIIGYVTNLAAIKMLFRPLREIRIFGLRLPFTPGLLPKERLKLADSVGRMIQRELLTPGVLKERLANPEVQASLESSLSAYTDQLLDRPLSYWIEEKNKSFPFTEPVGDFINSGAFNSFLEEVIKIWFLGAEQSGETEESFTRKLKNKFRDVGGLFVPFVRDFLRNALIKEMKNKSAGKPSTYRAALEKIIEKNPEMSGREFLLLEGIKKQKIDSFLALKVSGALDENISGALSSVDVRLLVSDRINSLDMLQVEKMILEIVAVQLRWISLFGGVLGGLIGFVQVGISFFTG